MQNKIIICVKFLLDCKKLIIFLKPKKVINLFISVVFKTDIKCLTVIPIYIFSEGNRFIIGVCFDEDQRRFLYCHLRLLERCTCKSNVTLNRNEKCQLVTEDLVQELVHMEFFVDNNYARYRGLFIIDTFHIQRHLNTSMDKHEITAAEVMAVQNHISRLDCRSNNSQVIERTLQVNNEIILENFESSKLETRMTTQEPIQIIPNKPQETNVASKKKQYKSLPLKPVVHTTNDQMLALACEILVSENNGEIYRDDGYYLKEKECTRVSEKIILLCVYILTFCGFSGLMQNTKIVVCIRQKHQKKA